MRRIPLVCALVIGLGLAAAPLAFRMFERAPKGADMLDEFRPFMTDETISTFEGYLAEMDAADAEAQERLRPYLAETGAVPDDQFDQQYPFVATFNEEWPAIEDDMSGLLRDVGDNVDNYEAVDALPPFTLFPWFFVLPGLMIAGVAATALVRGTGSLRWVLAGLGVALIAAPAVFQMFTRAPEGGEMIDTFRPIMERERVQRIQGYFVAIGGAEGSLRAQALPQTGLGDADLDEQFPAIRELNADWQTIVADDTGFAAMVGAMSDNVDNYQAVDALPPFPLFPWFFVIPGVLMIGLALAGKPRTVPLPKEPTMTRPSQFVAGTLAAALVLATLTVTTAAGAAGGKGKKLVGTFEIDAGTCDASGEASGSYFRMVQIGGTVDDGPYIGNLDSTCANPEFTLLEPGTDGGLFTGEYQPQPDPPFDDAGNGVADGIHQPTGFFGIQFASSTNETDPQTGEDVRAPTIRVKGSKLRGNISAYSVAYGNQQFNQGAPKPDGELPGLTAKLTGTYDSDTREFEIEWVSQIVGGPFNDFTGIWHFEGTFVPEKDD